MNSNYTITLIGKDKSQRTENMPKTYEDLIILVQNRLKIKDIIPSLKFENEDNDEMEVGNENDYSLYVIGQDGIKVYLKEEGSGLSKSKSDNSSFSKDVTNKSNCKEDEEAISNYLDGKIYELTQLLQNFKNEKESQDKKIAELQSMISSQTNNKEKEGQQYFNTSQQSLKSSKVIHLNIKCSKCNEMNIKGRRYKCLQCPSLNYCGTCRETIDHEHDLVVFTKVKENLSAKFASNKNKFNYPKDKVFEIEMINNGDLPWPNDITLKCLEGSEIIFHDLAMKNKNVQPNQKIKCNLEFEDLESFEKGTYFANAQLMHKNKQLSPMTKIYLLIENNNDDEDNQFDNQCDDQEDVQNEDQDDNNDNQEDVQNEYEDDNNDNQEEEKEENTELIINNSTHRESNNYHVNQKFNNMNKGNRSYGKNDTNNFQNKPFTHNNNYYNIYQGINNTNHLSNQIQNQFDQRSNNHILEKRNSNYQFKSDSNSIYSKTPDGKFIDSEKYDNEYNQLQIYQENIIVQSKVKSNALIVKDETNKFYVNSYKNNQKKEEPPSKDNGNDVDYDKLRNVYTFLEKYTFEPTIPKNIIEEVIIQNNYDSRNTIDKLWDIFDQRANN